MLLLFLSLQNSCHFRYIVFLVVVLNEAGIISFAESRMSCVLMFCSIERRNSTSFSFGYSGYFLFVPGKCRCWLVNVVVVFITFLRITGNQLWVPNNRIISSILDDSFLTFNSVFQTNLNGGKQYIYKQIVSSFF